MRAEPSVRAGSLVALAILSCAGGCEGDVIRLGAGREPRDAAADVVGFGAPAAIESISGPDGKDDDPSLSADLTLLYFNSTRNGGAGKEDIWFSRRSDARAAWQPPELVPELNSEDRETGIALAADGLTILFSSDREGGSGGLDVYVARRADRARPWSEPQRVAELCSSQDDLVSSLSSSGRSIYLARRDGDDDDDYDLFVARREAVEQAWQEPLALEGLNTDAEESDAFEAAQGEQLLFTRDEDLYLARRAAGPHQFEAAAPLDELNSADDDRDPWASPDLRYLVFSSNRTGPYLLYEARR
jgi:hypothetical protein